MRKKTEGDDLHQVMREERRRGRRPVDEEAIKERKRLLKAFLDLLQSGDEPGFLRAIRALGLQDGSEEFERAHQIWKMLRRERKLL
jgi:hypothetical protein